MADEKGGLSSYLSFADRYQADLEFIYHKYDKTFEDGTVESEEILLSNLEDYDDGGDWFDDLVSDHKHGNDDDKSDEGWESDTSGPTDGPSQDELNDPTSFDTKDNNTNQLDKAISTETQDGKIKNPNCPLSSTVVSDIDSVFDHKVDPNLSPVAHLDTGTILNNIDNVRKATLEMPKIVEFNVQRTDEPTNNRKATKNASETDCTVTSFGQNAVVKQDSPVVHSSLAEAILSTRNRIANVLFEAVLNSQGETSSKSSGYESALSSDSTSSTIQRTSTLFFADKLLKEFNSRLTAEIMSRGNESFSTRNKDLPIVKPKKSRMLIRPNMLVNRGKRKTVSLLATRKAIKVNPSIQLATKDNRMRIELRGSRENSSSVLTSTSGFGPLRVCSPSKRGSPDFLPGRISVGGLTVKTQNSREIIPSNTKFRGVKVSSDVIPVRVQSSPEIVPRNRDLPSLDSRVPIKVVSTKAVLKLSPGLPPIGKFEVSMSNNCGTTTQSLQSACLSEKRISPFAVIKEPLSTLTVNLPKLSLPSNHRRSVPLLPSQPGQNSDKDQRRVHWTTQDINLKPGKESNRDIERRVTTRANRNTNLEGNSDRMVSQDTNKFPRQESDQDAPKIDTNVFARKRNFDDDDAKLTSPKRICYRPCSSNYHEICYIPAGKKSQEESSESDTSNSLKRSFQEDTTDLPQKRHRECICDCSRSLEEITGKTASSACTSKMPRRRSSVKLPQDTKSGRIQLNSTSSDLNNNSCMFECNHAHSYDNRTADSQDNSRTSNSIFLEERFHSPSEHFNENVYDKPKCGYNENITQKNVRQEQEVFMPSRRTSLGEFERLYNATKQKKKQTPSTAKSIDNYQVPPSSKSAEARKKSTDNMHKCSEAFHKSPAENRRVCGHNSCNQYETSPTENLRSNRHTSSEQCEKSEKTRRRQYKMLQEQSKEEHVQCRKSPNTPWSSRSDSPAPEKRLPVGFNPSKSPNSLVPYCESPAKASPNYHKQFGRLSTIPRRPENCSSSGPYQMSDVKTRRTGSPKTLGPCRALEVQSRRRRSPHSSERHKKHLPNAHMSHSPTSTEGVVYDNSPVKSRKTRTQESSNSCRKRTTRYKSDNPVYVETRRNSPNDHLENHRQRGSAKYFARQSNRHHTLGQSSSAHEMKQQRCRECPEADTKLKPYKTDCDNFLRHKTRNLHKILESTRKEYLEPVTQCKHVASGKDRRQVSKKRRHAIENALHCVPGHCKKTICFDCGSFSLEETDN